MSANFLDVNHSDESQNTDSTKRIKISELMIPIKTPWENYMLEQIKKSSNDFV